MQLNHKMAEFLQYFVKHSREILRQNQQGFLKVIYCCWGALYSFQMTLHLTILISQHVCLLSNSWIVLTCWYATFITFFFLGKKFLSSSGKLNAIGKSTVPTWQVVHQYIHWEIIILLVGTHFFFYFSQAFNKLGSLLHIYLGTVPVKKCLCWFKVIVSPSLLWTSVSSKQKKYIIVFSLSKINKPRATSKIQACEHDGLEWNGVCGVDWCLLHHGNEGSQLILFFNMCLSLYHCLSHSTQSLLIWCGNGGFEWITFWGTVIHICLTLVSF